MSVGGDSRFIGTTGAPFGGQSIYDWSAGNVSSAGDATRQAGEMYATGGMSPDAAQATASTAAAPNSILSGIEQYMNPYTQQVIDRSLADIDRSRQMQLNDVGAQATSAGAFGGARHGLVEAQTNEAAQRASGDLSAQLRNQGWNSAAGLSGQDILNAMNTGQFNAAQQTGTSQFNANQQNSRDIAAAQDQFNRAGGLAGVGAQIGNLGVTGYDLGRQTAADQMQAGGMQQMLQQMILDRAGGQFQQTANQPQSMLDTMMSALGMSPMNNERTTTQNYNPGLFDYLQIAAGLGSSALQGGRGT